MIANLYPQLSWLVPQAETDVIGLAWRTASSPDQQQPNAILPDLDAVRQSIDRIATSIASSQEQMTTTADRIATSQDQIARSVDRMATSQEQIARSVDQLTADQEQMTREITKLQEIERSIRSKNSETSPRPASASAAKPVPAPKPLSRPSQAPFEWEQGSYAGFIGMIVVPGG